MDLVLNFDTPQERWRSEQVLLWYLMILTLRNFWFLLDNPDYPHLYDSDMVYLLPEQLERKPTKRQLKELQNFLRTTMRMTDDEIQHHLDLAQGVEIFRDIPRMAEHGGGDCDNWAAARAAEVCVAAYRLGGKSGARPYLVWREDGDRMIYHAKVLHDDGSDEDPSLIKGMGGQDRAAERLEECRKNYERYDNLWQDAKQMLATEIFSSESERVARAQYLKDAIDSFGYLPSDGVFRVGPKQQSAVVGDDNWAQELARMVPTAYGSDGTPFFGDPTVQHAHLNARGRGRLHASMVPTAYGSDGSWFFGDPSVQHAQNAHGTTYGPNGKPGVPSLPRRDRTQALARRLMTRRRHWFVPRGLDILGARRAA